MSLSKYIVYKPTANHAVVYSYGGSRPLAMEGPHHVADNIRHSAKGAVPKKINMFLSISRLFLCWRGAKAKSAYPVSSPVCSLGECSIRKCKQGDADCP